MKEGRKPQYCKLTHEFIDGDAFSNLSSGATRALLLMFRLHDGFNNGTIVCSKRDVMKWCRCGSPAAMAYLRELQTSGIVTRTQKGRYHRFGDRTYCTESTWRLNFIK